MFLKLPRKRGSSESGVLCNPGKSVPGGGLCDESTHRENFPRSRLRCQFEGRYFGSLKPTAGGSSIKPNTVHLSG